jgi:hypothetical protein
VTTAEKSGGSYSRDKCSEQQQRHLVATTTEASSGDYTAEHLVVVTAEASGCTGNFSTAEIYVASFSRDIES